MRTNLDAGPLIYRIVGLNGCTVLYEIGLYALVLTPTGECYRAAVAGDEVELTIIPPAVNLERIESKRKPLRRKREVMISREAHVSLQSHSIERILKADDGVMD